MAVNHYSHFLLRIQSFLKKNQFSSRRAFTFIEVMVTISVFSLGVVAIMQVFRLSLDRLQHLTNRIYANTLIENKISTIERVLRSQKTLPYDADNDETLTIGAKAVTFKEQLTLSTVDNFLDLFKLDLTLSWQEGEQTKTLSRSTYIIDLRLDN